MPSVAGGAQAFYDCLAPDYHLIFEDWDRSLLRQGRALTAILRSQAPQALSVLDLACGIGTQALALAKKGYQVTAEDLSPVSVARAKREAKRRGLTLHFGVGDMRRAASRHAGAFDVVLACDNSLPHLLNDRAILKAFKQARACLKPGGLYLISVRDYAQEPKQGGHFRPYGIRKPPGGQVTLFQTWSFRGPLYDLSFYKIRERTGRPPQLSVSKTTCYAVTTTRLMALMRQAGFAKVQRLDDAFYQPVLIGRAL